MALDSTQPRFHRERLPHSRPAGLVAGRAPEKKQSPNDRATLLLAWQSGVHCLPTIRAMTSLHTTQSQPVDNTSPARLVTRPFVLVVACNMAIFTAIGVLTPVLPRLVTKQLGGNNADLGRMTLIYAVGAIGSRPLLSIISRRFGAKQNMMLGAAIAGVGFMLNYNVQSFGVLGLSRAISAVGEALSWVGFSTLISEMAPENRQAEATSISTLCRILHKVDNAAR